MQLFSEWRGLLASAVVAVIEDIAATVVCIKTRRDRRKSTTAVMVSLLLSDMLFGAVLIPVRIVEISLNGRGKLSVFYYVYAYVLFLSAFNALFLSFERYASVIRPLWRRLIGTRTIVKGLFLTWLFPAVISLLPLTWSFIAGYDSKVTQIYSYFLLALLCFSTLAVLSLQIRVLCGLFSNWSSSQKKVRLHRAKGNSVVRNERQQRVKSTVLVLLLIATSIVTWLPTIIYNIKPDAELTGVSLFTLMMNSMVDPLLIVGFHIQSLMKSISKKQPSTEQLKSQGTSHSRFRIRSN